MMLFSNESDLKTNKKEFNELYNQDMSSKNINGL